MLSTQTYLYARRDDIRVADARLVALEAGYAENMRVGRPPYAGVRICTNGELQWIMEERHWSGQPNPRGMGRADLRDADLRGAHLQEAALFEADLRHADCTGICLQRAVLRWANCQETNLSDGNLCSAYLFGANLSGANFRRAQLVGANMQGTILRAALFADADLRGASLRWADIDEDSLDRMNALGVNTYWQVHTEPVRTTAEQEG
jgi:uncharacterized protein YjbI with pentapeptide repeats